MERTAMLPAAERLVADLRQAFADGLEETARWRHCRGLLQTLLGDGELRAHAEAWPVTGFDGRKVSNLLFYVDPDYGFAINALIKNPGGRAMVHDHGPSWTIYGLLRGTERIVRYDAAPCGNDSDCGRFHLTETEARTCGPGEVDIVPPGQIHCEFAGDEKSIAVIVRSRRSGTFDQFRYLDDGSRTVMRGPEQIPYKLS